MQPNSNEPDSIVQSQPEQVQVPEPPVAEEPLNLEENSTTPPSPVVSKHSKKKPLIITLVVVVILAIAGGIGYWWWQQHQSVPQVSQKQTATTATTPTPAISDPQLAKFINPTTGEQWLAEPKALTDQKLMTGASDTTKYYEVGSRDGRTILMSLTQVIGDSLQLYEQAADGTITYIEQPDAYAKYDSSATTAFPLRAGIKSDKTIHYDSLSLPKSFTLSSGEIVTRSDLADLGSFTFGQEPNNTVKKSTIKTLGSSKLTRVEHPYVDTNLTSINYGVELPIGTTVNLNYQPIAQDLSAYKWDNGQQPTDTIHGIVRGCGSSSISVSRGDNVSGSDFVAAGKASDGKVVYAFKDKSNVLVAKAYDEYKLFYADDTTNPVVPLDDFLSQHAIIAYKNAFNEWLIYTRDKLAPSGGCAKPVVYLYPTKTQNVTVKVGADVKLSDPHYDPKTGWQVVADPSGRLTLHGAQYGSLFWEGPGYGAYPAITSGTVVKHNDALATIRTQLVQQGLNTVEANDFIGYWQSRIPNKPYIRLAWFDTAQMNGLAPLAISPHPDTLIRVFLDMDGFDQPVKMPAQQLKTTPRSGFTVVEWGGLSRTKLY